MLSLKQKIAIEKERRRRRHAVEWAKCAADIVYWCNNYVKGYDPRKIDQGLDPNVPFVLYPFQVAALQKFEWGFANQKAILVEKSRDMGFSYLTIIFDMHKWIFTNGYKAGWGSYKQEKVDRRGDMDSMFEKARHLISALPFWMIPKGFKVAGEYDNYMRLTNPVTGATITGEVGDNVGRGGRNSRYTLDEFAFFQRPDNAEKGVSQNTNCRVYVSTVNGMGNLFARKRFSMPEEQIIISDWREHPDKDQTWYDKQVEELDEVTLAQEVDRDYGAAVEGIMIPQEWVMAAVELDLEKSGPKIAGLDVGEKKDTSCYISRHGVVVTRIEEWGKRNTTQSAFKARDLAREDGVEIMRYDDIGIGAGITGTLETEQQDAEQGEDIEDILEDVELIGVNWGNPDVKGEPLWDNENRSLKERFMNQRVADYYHLRLRFESTYEHVNGIKEHPLDHLISIPRDHGLISELSLPLMQYSSVGKMKLESKKDMKRRGIKSPNKSDALAYCFSTYEPASLIGVY